VRQRGKNALPAARRIPDRVEARHEPTRPRLRQEVRCGLTVERLQDERAREMKAPSREEVRALQLFCPQARARAREVQKRPLAGGVHEHDAGGGRDRRIGQDTSAVDAPPVQKGEDESAEGVLADLADDPRRETQPDEGAGRVESAATPVERDLVDKPQRAALGKLADRTGNGVGHQDSETDDVHGGWITYPGGLGMRAQFVSDVEAAVGSAGVISEPEQLRTYECDGLTSHRVVPGLVALPASTAEVQAVVRLCARDGIPFVARGAGTGLSGGALPVAEGIVISLARMDRILEVDLESARVTAQPGVTNLAITEAVASDGFFYAPDPSSQQVCTIGGNVAENSGGAHCLKHGFTVNHVLEAEVVLPDGELVRLCAGDPGPDLLGAFIGSEGTLGIATEIVVRVLRRPETVRTLLAGFDSTDQAGVAVSGVIAARILPAAIEMMDRLTIEAAEAAVHPGYPEVAAVLIVELDGLTMQVEHDLAAVETLCLEAGAVEIRVAADDAERALLWLGRRSAFAAMGRVSHDYYVQDGVVPRTRLPEVLRRIAELEREHGLRVGNVFHAGDGNLHPLVLYDAREAGQAERAQVLADAILDACMDAGGSLTGEHGIGVDKACAMPSMFGPDDLQTMGRLRLGFDPAGLANPGKLLPTPRLCGEVPGPYRAHPLEKAGLAERL
jgi:glycolate oxidase